MEPQHQLPVLPCLRRRIFTLSHLSFEKRRRVFAEADVDSFRHSRCGPFDLALQKPVGPCRVLSLTVLRTSRCFPVRKSVVRPRTRNPPPLRRHTPGREGFGATWYFHLSTHFVSSMMSSSVLRRRTWTSGRNDTTARAGQERIERLARPDIGALPPALAEWHESSFAEGLPDSGRGLEAGGVTGGLPPWSSEGRCKQLNRGPSIKEPPGRPCARSSSCTTSRMNRRRRASKVTSESQVMNVVSSCRLRGPSDGSRRVGGGSEEEAGAVVGTATEATAGAAWAAPVGDRRPGLPPASSAGSHAIGNCRRANRSLHREIDGLGYGVRRASS